MKIKHQSRKVVAAAALVGLVGIGGAGVAAAAGPSSDSSSPSPSSSSDQGWGNQARKKPDADRNERLTKALAPLVKDGTLTQAQADKVTETLANAGPAGEHRRGHLGFGPAGNIDEAAKALGLTPEKLRESLSDGKVSLADVAKQQGVATDQLVKKLVAGTTERIEERVASGSLDRDRADTMLKDLNERITAMVNQGPRNGPGPGLGGRAQHGGWAPHGVSS